MNTRTTMPRVAAIVLTLTVLVLAGAGCGSSTKTVSKTGANGEVTTSTVPNIHFAKTKFVLHMGLAFGAFHRYIDKPFKAGAFRAGANGRVKALAKGAAAALFAVHELKTARDDALSDDHLRPLAEKVDDLLGRLTSLRSSLKGGSLNPGAILAAGGAVSSLGIASGGLGAAIKDLAPAL
jgi:hypothetical protein